MRVVDIANNPYNWVIRDWVGPPPVPGTDSHDLQRPASSKPFQLHWSNFGPGIVMVRSGGHAYYPNKLDPATWPRESSGPMNQVTELFRYFISRDDLDNPALTLLPSNGLWLRITPWLPWMLMGAAAGHIVYEGQFHASDTLAVFKLEVLSRIRERYPQYLEAPTKWSGPSLSSLEHYAAEQQPAPAKP